MEKAVPQLDMKLEKLNISSRCQPVIFPNHLQVPESFRSGLTFGSLDPHFDPSISCGKDSVPVETVPANDRTSMETGRSVTSDMSCFCIHLWFYISNVSTEAFLLICCGLRACQYSFVIMYNILMKILQNCLWTVKIFSSVAYSHTRMTMSLCLHWVLFSLITIQNLLQLPGCIFSSSGRWLSWQSAFTQAWIWKYITFWGIWCLSCVWSVKAGSTCRLTIATSADAQWL